MSIASSQRLLNEMSSSRICIDSYDNGELQGRVYNPCYPDVIEFRNVIQLLKVMERLFDKFEYPQTTMTHRHFNGNKVKSSPIDDIELVTELSKDDFMKTETKGKIATFRIQVRFRQNASWQGTLFWVEGNKQENFRSVLELIMLMDSSFTEGSTGTTSEEYTGVSAI